MPNDLSKVMLTAPVDRLSPKLNLQTSQTLPKCVEKAGKWTHSGDRLSLLIKDNQPPLSLV